MNKSENLTYHGLHLLKHCGSGAFGDVYYCEDIAGRRLAVKIISKQKLGDQWTQELRGVSNYRKITENVPELLQIYHVGEDEESFFYTMEAADSTEEHNYHPDTLAHRLKDGALPQDKIFSILSEIFAGIKIIHAAGFTHRDIKPDNILFVKGVPKLGDIGLMSSTTATLTQIAGTLDFLPPELREDGSEISDRDSRQKNDLYAFGKVIYCTITGENPHNWPAVPSSLPLSLPLKFFLRLSFQLCDKDQNRRLNSIDALEKELSEIERKLLYGETLRDKIRYSAKMFLNHFFGNLCHLWKWGKKHWISLLVAILCCAGGIYYLRPEPPKPPFDITQQKSKKYTNDAIGVSMDIPFQWDIISKETISKRLDEEKKESGAATDLEKKRLEFFSELLKHGADFICCDYTGNFPDNITIQVVPVPGSAFLESSEDELRLHMRQLYQGELGFNTEVYEIKKITMAGRPCIFLDLSHEPEKTRINNYMFALEDQCFAIALTAKKSTFAERREQFESVLSTLKISEK